MGTVNSTPAFVCRVRMMKRVHRASVLMGNSVLFVEFFHDSQRDFQRIQFIIDRNFPGSSIFHAVEKMLDFQLQRVVLMHKNSLDQGLLFVAERIFRKHVIRRGLPVNVNFLIGIIQNNVGILLGNGQGALLVLRGTTGKNHGNTSIFKFQLNADHVIFFRKD